MVCLGFQEISAQSSLSSHPFPRFFDLATLLCGKSFPKRYREGGKAGPSASLACWTWWILLPRLARGSSVASLRPGGVIKGQQGLRKEGNQRLEASVLTGPGEETAVVRRERATGGQRKA
jgi:hypothetical protein